MNTLQDFVLAALQNVKQYANESNFDEIVVNQILAAVCQELGVDDSEYTKNVADIVMDRLLPPVTDDRLLPPVTDCRLVPPVTNTLPSTQPKSTNKKDVHVDEVTIIIDYGPNSHALFGDMNKHPKFRDQFIKTTSWLSENERLAFGHGWVIRFKSKIGELKDALAKYGVKYRQTTKQAFEQEITNKRVMDSPLYHMIENDAHSAKTSGKANSATQITEQKKPEKVCTSKASSTNEIPPIYDLKKNPTKNSAQTKKANSTTQIVEQNKSELTLEESKEQTVNKQDQTQSVNDGKKQMINLWGNRQEKSTGFVLHPLILSGKKTFVVVGRQDRTADKSLKGLDSVLSLTVGLQQEAINRGHTVLTDEIIAKLKNKQLAETLKRLLPVTEKEDVVDVVESGESSQESSE